MNDLRTELAAKYPDRVGQYDRGILSDDDVQELLTTGAVSVRTNWDDEPNA